MRTVEQIKQEHDLELFVRQLPKWQAERRQREARRYHDNLIYMPRPRPHEVKEERHIQVNSVAEYGGMAILCTALFVLILCAILAV